MFFSTDAGAVAGIDLGELDLTGTFGVRGQAFVNDGVERVVDSGQVARVYAVRGRCSDVDDGIGAGFDLGEGGCAAESVARIEHGVEGEAAADNVGAWQLTRLIAGPADIVGVLYERNADGSLGAVLDVVGPIGVPGTATDEAPQDGGPRLAFDGVAPAPVNVDLVLSAPVGDDAFAVIAAQGTAIVACDVARAAAQGVIVPIAEGTTTARATAVAAGVHDVVVCDGDRRGTANGQLALPNQTALRWAVVLLAGDSCPSDPTDPGDATRDCDGDGRRGLPLSTIDALRTDCAVQCFTDSNSLGAAIAERTCTVVDAIYDCDDDSDGQPDVTEPVVCVGPGRGTDLDGGSLCSINDAFPHCAANTAAACTGGDEDITPVVPGGEAGPGFGNVNSFPFSDAVAGDGAIVTVPASSTLPARFAILGTLFNNTLSDRLPVFQLEADGVLTEADPGSTWSIASDNQLTPRLNFAIANNVIFGGAARECTSTTVPCPPEDIVEHIFAEQVVLQASTQPKVTMESSGRLRVPRVNAGATNGFNGVVVAGGLTCPEGVPVDVNGGVSCAPQTRVIAGTVEVVSSATTLAMLTPPHGVSVDRFFDSETSLVHIFVIGGDTSAPNAASTPSNAVEVFTFVQSGTLERTTDIAGDLKDARTQHAFTRVESVAGDVAFVVSGGAGAGDFSYEVWRPGSRDWLRCSLRTPRAQHAAVALPDGRVLLIGGINPRTGATVSTTEIIDPRPRRGTLPDGVRGTSLLTPRRRPLASVVDDGRVLILGGFDGDTPVQSAETFDVLREPVGDLVPIFKDEAFVGCSDGAIADDGTTIALRCATLPPELGYDDANGDDLLLVDIATGGITCATCSGGNGGSVVGAEALLSADGRRALFATTTALDPSDDNTAADLYSFERGTPGFHRLRSLDGSQSTGISGAFSAQLNVAGFSGPEIGVLAFVDDCEIRIGALNPTVRVVAGGGSISDLQIAGTVDDVRFVARADNSNGGRFIGVGTVGSGLGELTFTDSRNITFDETTAPVISPDGRHIAWFSSTPTDKGDGDGDVDLLHAAISESGTIDAVVTVTRDIDSACALAACTPLTISNEGRIAWVRTATDGRRAMISTVDAQGAVTNDQLTEIDAETVRLSASGAWATITTKAGTPASSRVFRVNVDAQLAGEGEGEGEGEDEGEGAIALDANGPTALAIDGRLVVLSIGQPGAFPVIHTFDEANGSFVATSAFAGGSSFFSSMVLENTTGKVRAWLASSVHQSMPIFDIDDCLR